MLGRIRHHSHPWMPRLSSATAALAAYVLLTFAALPHAVGQTAAEPGHDKWEFIDGLAEMQLVELLEHYMNENPPAGAIEAARYRVALHRAKLSTSDIQQHLQPMLEIRRQLITNHPEHPQRYRWMIDQCSDLLFHQMQNQGSDLAVLYGVPSVQQQERVVTAVEEMYRLSGQAADVFERQLRDMEHQPGFAGDAAAQMQRQALIAEYQQRKIPFFRGISSVLHAHLLEEEPARRRTQLLDAAMLLNETAPLLNESVQMYAHLYSGIAEALLSRFEEAEQKFRTVATTDNANERIVFMARMAGVLNRRTSRGPDAALTGLESITGHYQNDEDALFYRLIIVQQRLLLQVDRATEQTGVAAQDAAVDAIDAFLTSIHTEPQLSAAQRRTIALDTLTQIACRAEIPTETAPTFMQIARARSQSETDAPQAIDILQQVLNRDDLPTGDAALARYELARIYLKQQEFQSAAEVLHDVAAQFPAEELASQAVASAAKIYAALHRQQPGSQDILEQFAATLRLIDQRYPNLKSIDRWQHELAAVSFKLQDYDAVKEAAEKIDRQSPHWFAGRLLAVRSLLEQAREAAASDGNSRDLYEQALAAAGQLHEAHRSDRHSDSDDGGSTHLRLAQIDVLAAEALLHMDQPRQVIDRTDSIIARATDLPPTVIADAYRLRIDAWLALGEPARAVNDLEQLIANAAGTDVASLIPPLLQAMEADVDRLHDQGRADEAEEMARRELLPVVELVDQWLDGRQFSPVTSRLIKRRLARGYLLSGRFAHAAQIYEALLVQRPDDVGLLSGRAEALYHLGGDANLSEAMRLFKRIVAAGSGVGDEYYWLAQLRSLQILDRVGRNTHQILPQIRLLEQRDPELGGVRYRDQFFALRNKYRSG